jgi:diguanylate cyclase (GGDEF)-like protein
MTVVDMSMAAVTRDRVPSTLGVAGAAWHTSVAEGFGSDRRWGQAYRHLRTADRLLNGRHGANKPAEAWEQHRRDSLTATYSRHYLDERLVALLGDPGDVGAAGIAVALLDVDHFMQVNDAFGHQFGDRVLQRIVAVVDAGLPDGAFCARYGGEEFAIVLPGPDRHRAVRACEAARERVDHHPWHELAPGLRPTVSVGVAHGFGPVIGHDGLVAAADRLLYAAKRAGGNVVAFQEADIGPVQLAGPAAGRLSIPQPPVAAPRCGSEAFAP